MDEPVTPSEAAGRSDDEAGDVVTGQTGSVGEAAAGETAPSGPPVMDYSFRSGDLDLSGHLAEPHAPAHDAPGLVLCHGFPTRGRESQQSGKSFPELAERIASERAASCAKP